MLEIGSDLRRAREAQGLSLADAEKATRVRSRYLRALEDDQLDLLPPGPYARLFLRGYASFLGLDPDPLLAALPEPEPEIAPRPRPSPLPPLPLRAAALVLGAIVVAVLALVVASRPGGNGARPTAPQPQAALQPRAALPRRSAKPKSAPAATPRRQAKLTAVHGDCWILVRRGGRVVWEGTLRSGSTLRLSLATQLQLRLGAPWNLLLDGRELQGLPHAPANVVLSQAGLAAA